MKKDWHVKVKGLGGPHAEFNERTFYIRNTEPGEAIEKAIRAFVEMDKSEGERWNRDFGKGWSPYEFCSAYIRRAEDFLVIEEGG